MNPLSTWTFYSRHKRHALLLLSLSIVVTIGLYSLVALVWGVYVEQPRLAYMTLSKFSMVTPGFDRSDPDQEVIAQIQTHPDVAEVIPTKFIILQIPGMVPAASFQFDLFGLAEDDIPYILERFDATLLNGHLPEPGTNELLVSEDVANMLDLQVGEIYNVMSSEFYPNVDIPLEPTPFELVGIAESEVELGIVSLEYLDSHRLYRNFPARLLVAAQESRETAVDNFLRSEIQTLEISVMTLTMLNERILEEALPGLVLLLPIVLIVVTALSLVFVVINQIANAQRLPEFGILHATGHSKKWLIRRLTLETTALAILGWVMGIGVSWLVLYLLKMTYFASQGHDFNYVAWIPIVFSLPLPAVIAGFTFISVRRTLNSLDPVAIVERRELSQEGDQIRKKRISQSSPKPLAPTTFYNRHRRRAVLLMSGTSMIILAVVLIIFALALTADAQEPFFGYLSRVSIVRSPAGVEDLDPSVVELVKEHPTVERVIPIAPRISMLQAAIPLNIGSAEASPFGVYTADMAFLIELYDLELKEGHLPDPGTNEMVIPEILAQNRDIKIGDVIGDPNRPAYPGATSLPVEFVISGIFAQPESSEDGVGWGFISLEFLETSEPFPIPEIPSLIVVPKDGQKESLDNWLENELVDVNASVLTQHQEISRVQEKAQQNMLGLALLEVVLGLVAASVLAVLNYIFTSQRQAEFGVLHALGYGRMQLVGRVFGETAFTTLAAWGFGAILTLVLLLFLRFAVFDPRGLAFNLFNVTPWLYTLPIPIVVLVVTAGSTARTLSKIDPISIIEMWM
jgi:ABC-type antimicrobial peptide transport system permease subunit